jgi:hypothetical protein
VQECDGWRFALGHQNRNHQWDAFEPKLDRLYIATTAERDGALQKEVREISERRGKEKKFKVDVLFWDDICQDLAKDDDVFFSHYPQFRDRTDPIIEHDKKLYEELTGFPYV